MQTQGLVIEGGRQPTLAEGHSELQRERLVRERCYPKWIQEGKLTAVDANDRYRRLKLAENILERVVDAAREEATYNTLAKLGLFTGGEVPF